MRELGKGLLCRAGALATALCGLVLGCDGSLWKQEPYKAPNPSCTGDGGGGPTLASRTGEPATTRPELPACPSPLSGNVAQLPECAVTCTSGETPQQHGTRLRDALRAMSTWPSVTVYLDKGCTFELTCEEPTTPTLALGRTLFPPIVNGRSLIIEGRGATLQLAGTTPARFFFVGDRGHLVLRDLSLRGGRAQGGAGGSAAPAGRGIGGGGGGGLGGAVLAVKATVELSRVLFYDNRAQGGDGGSGQSDVISSVIGHGSGGGGLGGDGAPPAAATAGGGGGAQTAAMSSSGGGLSTAGGEGGTATTGGRAIIGAAGIGSDGSSATGASGGSGGADSAVDTGWGLGGNGGSPPDAPRIGGSSGLVGGGGGGGGTPPGGGKGGAGGGGGSGSSNGGGSTLCAGGGGAYGGGGGGGSTDGGASACGGGGGGLGGGGGGGSGTSSATSPGGGGGGGGFGGGGGGGGGAKPRGGAGGFGGGGGGGSAVGSTLSSPGSGGDAGFGGGSGGLSGGGGGAGLGGALFILAGQLTASDCEFINNGARGGVGGNRGATAIAGTPGVGLGGALFTMGPVKVTLTHSTFAQNAVASGDDSASGAPYKPRGPAIFHFPLAGADAGEFTLESSILVGPRALGPIVDVDAELSRPLVKLSALTLRGLNVLSDDELLKLVPPRTADGSSRHIVWSPDWEGSQSDPVKSSSGLMPADPAEVPQPWFAPSDALATHVAAERGRSELVAAVSEAQGICRERALDLRKGQRTQAPGVCLPGAIEVVLPACMPGSCQVAPHHGARPGAGNGAGVLLLLVPALWLSRRRALRGARALLLFALFALWALSACSGGSTGASDGGDANQDLGGGGGVDYAPYFYTWGFGSTSYPFKSLVEMKQKGGPSAATLAFVLGNSAGSPACSVTTDGTTNVIETVMKDDLTAFRAAGGRLKASFGGANGLNLDDDRACQTAMELFTTIDGFVSRTGLTDLDFDVEQPGVLTAAVNLKRAQALKLLQDKRPEVRISLTLPSLPRDKNGTPGGLTMLGLEAVRAMVQAGVRLTHVNLMTMDFGPYYSTGRTLGELATSALTDAQAQLKPVFGDKGDAALWALLGATPMIGQNDVSSEVFSQQDASTLAAFAKQQRLGRLSFWAAQRDQPCPMGSTDLALCSRVNTAPFEFHRLFAAVP